MESPAKRLCRLPSRRTSGFAGLPLADSNECPERRRATARSTTGQCTTENSLEFSSAQSKSWYPSTSASWRLVPREAICATS